MKRRSFLKFLAIAPLAPKVAIDVISKVGPKGYWYNIKPVVYGGAWGSGKTISPKFIYGKVSISRSAIDDVWGQGITELLHDKIKAQERFFKDIHYYAQRTHQR